VRLAAQYELFAIKKPRLVTEKKKLTKFNSEKSVAYTQILGDKSYFTLIDFDELDKSSHILGKKFKYILTAK
jgi:hypothetical protein